MKTQTKTTRRQIAIATVGAAIVVGAVVAFFAGLGGVTAFFIGKLGVGFFVASFIE